MVDVPKLDVRYVAALIVVALAATIYCNTLFNEFTNWDDELLVLENRFIVRLTPARIISIFIPGRTQSYQPLRDLSYAIDYSIWRQNAFGYHLGNVILFAANALLIYLLARKVFGVERVALLAALLFAVHPIHVEVVAWVAGRKDLLAGGFFAGALILYAMSVKDERRFPKLYACALGCYVCALFSKATTVTFPAILLLYDYCIIPGMTFRALLKRWKLHLPFWALTGVFMAVTISVASGSGAIKSYYSGSALLTFLTMMKVFLAYIRLLIVPVGLMARYIEQPVLSAGDATAWAAAVAVLLLVGLGFFLLRKSRRTAFCILWYFACLAPSSNIIPISTLMADRYLYLSSIGFCFLVAMGAERVLEAFEEGGVRRLYARRAALVLFSLVLLLMSVLSVRRNVQWRNSRSLWEADLARVPNSMFALNNLGLAYDRGEEREKAIELFGKAIELVPEFGEAHANLGNVYFDMDDMDRAQELYEKALSLSPNLAGLHHSIGMIELRRGDVEAALKRFAKCVEIDPYHWESYSSIGTVYLQSGLHKEAMDAFKMALDINPDSPQDHNNLGLVYYRVGQLEEALIELRKALKINPESASAHFNLGNVLSRLERLAEAEKEYEQAIALYGESPEVADVYANLGGTYSRMGLTDKTMEQFEKARAISPDNPVIRFNIAAVHMARGERASALKELDETVAIVKKAQPEPLMMHFRLGDSYARLGEMDRSLSQYAHVLELAPNMPQAMLSASRVYALKGEFDEAISQIDRVAALSSELKPAAMMAAAGVYMQQGKTDLAKHTLTDLIEEVPSFEQAKQMLEDIEKREASEAPENLERP